MPLAADRHRASGKRTLSTSMAAAALLALASCDASLPDSSTGVGGPRGGGGSPPAPMPMAAAAPGEVLPFGQMASACGTPAAALGPAIAAEAGYAVHDADPTATAPRTHFVTGFRDGCPRQVTAALVLFGDVATHETMRYATDDQAYGPADAAYESLKGRECGVPSGQPCGDALDRLAADTVFLSLYPAFGAAESADVLLHAGEVLAQEL